MLEGHIKGFLILNKKRGEVPLIVLTSCVHCTIPKIFTLFCCYTCKGQLQIVILSFSSCLFVCLFVCGISLMFDSSLSSFQTVLSFVSVFRPIIYNTIKNVI